MTGWDKHLYPEAERKKHEQDNALREMEEDLVNILSTPTGKRFLHWFVMEHGQMQASAMTGNAQTYYLLGLQDAAKRLLLLPRIEKLWHEVRLERLNRETKPNG